MKSNDLGRPHEAAAPPDPDPGPATGWLGRAAALPDALASRLQRSVVAWPLAALAALVMLVISETSHERSMQAMAKLEQRSAATLRIQQALRRLLDADTGQRGYLLTGRKVYLEPYEAAAADARAALDWLQDFYADDAAARGQLAELRHHAQARLAELAAAVQAFDAGGREQLLPLLAAQNLQHLQAVRRLADELSASQGRQLQSGRQAVFENLRISRIGVNVSAAIGLLALLMVLRQTAALETMQRRHGQAMLDEQARLEAEVVRRTNDLTKLARYLPTVREDESSRLAHDLHEQLGALLTTTKLNVLRLRHELGGTPPEAVARLDHLGASIDSGISLKRRIIDDLRPSSLSNLGLVSALEIQAREFAERSGLHVSTELAPVALSDTGQITVYRLVQEALTNVAKYAQATEVQLRLEPRPDGVHISVCDDGVGFDPDVARPHAHGLMGMRFRVEAVGGRLSASSAPGQGTCIEARLPASEDDSAGDTGEGSAADTAVDSVDDSAGTGRPAPSRATPFTTPTALPLAPGP